MVVEAPPICTSVDPVFLIVMVLVSGLALTSTAPKPTLVGSNLMELSAASEGFARTKATSRAASAASMGAPMMCTPSRAEVGLFIEHLRFCEHMLRGVSATVGASSLQQSLRYTSLGGSEQCCITSFRQPGYLPKWGPVALRPRLAARLPFRGAIPRNLPSSVKCTEEGRKIHQGPDPSD